VQSAFCNLHNGIILYDAVCHANLQSVIGYPYPIRICGIVETDMIRIYLYPQKFTDIHKCLSVVPYPRTSGQTLLIAALFTLQPAFSQYQFHFHFLRSICVRDARIPEFCVHARPESKQRPRAKQRSVLLRVCRPTRKLGYVPVRGTQYHLSHATTQVSLVLDPK